MVRQSSNIKKFVNDLDDALSPEVHREKVMRFHRSQTQLILNNLLKFAPTGSLEPRNANKTRSVRPSERLWGQTLAGTLHQPGAMEFQFFPHNEGLNAFSFITVDHPSYNENKFGIFEWLNYGTKSHPIYPRQADVLAFWYGPPLRWGGGSGEFVLADEIANPDHPGVAKGEYAFMDRADEASREIGERAFDSMMQEMLDSIGDSKYLAKS